MWTPIAGALAQRRSTAAQIAAGIAAGASVVPDLKAFNQHVGDTRTAELNPTMRVTAQMQGTSSEFIAVSHYEGCAGVIDGANYSVQTPLMTSIMQDSFGRPVEGSAAQGMDVYADQTTPGVPIITGTKNTKGVAFLSHIFIGDGAALDPYGTFSFTDPVTGKQYSAHTTEDKIQKQPRLRVNISDGLKFGAATGDANIGKPVEIRLADKLGLQLVDDTTDTSADTHKAVGVLADLSTIGFDPDTGALVSLIGKGGNGSDHLKAGDGIQFLPGAAPTDAPTLTPHAGSGLAIDASYDYAYTVTTSKGDTGLSPTATITTDATNRNVQIDVPAQPSGSVGTGIRVVRRSSARAASGSDPGSPAGTWKTVATVIGPLSNPFSMVDSIPSTQLGADYTESATSINTWFAATATNPGSLTAIPGTSPSLFNISGMKYGGDDGKGNMVNLDPAALKIDPAHGWITTVGGSSAPIMFSALTSTDASAAAQTMTHDTKTTVQWNGPLHDADGFLGSDGVTITFPADGWYEIDLNLDLQAGSPVIGDSYFIDVPKNGSAWWTPPNVPQANDVVGRTPLYGHVVDHFVSGDSIVVKIDINSASDCLLSAGTHISNISIVKVG